MRRRHLTAALFAAFLIAPVQEAASAEEGPETMPDFAGREEVYGYCIGCHSMKLVGRQGMDRARWDQTLSWMTEKHNMPAPEPDMRKLLLDYLAAAYPAKAATGGWTSPFAPQR